jgi:phospholipase D1/2
VALVCAALFAAWRYTPLSEYITHERVESWARAVRDTGWAPFAVVLAYTPAAFVMFPRPLLTLFTVIAFGPWLGFAYSMAGIMLAALATYYAGRVMHPETVRRWVGDELHERSEWLRRHGLLAVFALRIVAVAPFSVEGILAGAVRISVWQYHVGTFAGMAPGVLVTTVFGRQITTALEDPAQINWWLVGGAVVAFMAFSLLVGRWFTKHSEA